MRALGFIVGVILLLPGACSLGFMSMSAGQSAGSLGPIPALRLICFLVSAGGVAMIVRAVQGPRRPRDPPT